MRETPRGEGTKAFPTEANLMACRRRTRRESNWSVRLGKDQNMLAENYKITLEFAARHTQGKSQGLRRRMNTQHIRERFNFARSATCQCKACLAFHNLN